MLGLDSNIVPDDSQSLVSVQAKRHQDGQESNSMAILSKNNPSTNQASNVADKNQKIKALKIRIQQIENQKETMHQKLESYVAIIEKQAVKKNEQNAQIEALIKQCQADLKESQTDISTITNILTSKKKPVISTLSHYPTPKRLQLNHPNKVLRNKIIPAQQNSINSQNNTQQIQSSERVVSNSKHFSPSNRILALARSKKTSPGTLDEKQGNRIKKISPGYRKVKSPFKF